VIPDNVEKIIMTKEDYDRNVEQLLVDKCKAELEVERLNNIIENIEKYFENELNEFKKVKVLNLQEPVELLEYYVETIKELKGE